MDRRKFVQGAAAAGIGLSLTLADALSAKPGKLAAATGATLFVGTKTGTGSRGVYAYHWDSAKGTLAGRHLAATTPSPTYITLSPDHHLLFAANEVDSFQGQPSGGVSSFRVGASGLLTPINATPSQGAGTCFVGVDPSGRTLLAANYTGGSVASFSISPDGVLSPAISQFHYQGHGPNADRQEAPHAHRAIASPGGKHALFCDLGLDLIHIYHLDAATSQLTPAEPAAWQAPAGSGPRALRFHPNGAIAYCVLEMAASVAVLAWDELTSSLKTVQIVKLTPEGFSGRAQASEIVVDGSGTYAYAACRYYDTLVTFAVDPTTSLLSVVAHSTCGGKVPRDITLDPSEHWMLVANQDSDEIVIIARDPATGQLAETSATTPLVKPQCLVFA